VLEDFLDKFAGCLLLVSHDRYFMDHLVNQLFVFEGDGHIRVFNGNYSDYRDWLEEKEAMESRPKAAKSTPVETPSPSSTDRKKASYKEKQEFEKLQEEISLLEKRKGELTGLLNSGNTDHQQLVKWGEELNSVNASIEEKTLRWLALSELVE
jgi:ATP-binding cassette subfamily F protein uup